ncbi:TolC family outer membrane protein [Phaeovulum sp.]|uniref:TolC family outer membrane protein n=1 Tax=Phaeovulum sp. TaxID=2934796 RepID=UPI003567363A
MKNGVVKAFVLAGTLATSAFVGGAVQAQSLADAMVAAYRNSNLLEQNRATLRAADEDVAQAVASLRPVISWSASTSYNSTATNTTTNLLALSASLTLYDFGRSRIGIEYAKEAVLATRQALVAVEQDVLLSAVSAYTGVKSATETVAISRNSVRVIGESLRAANDRFAVGEVTRTDVALAEARLAAARAALTAAEGQLASARESYRVVTGSYPVSINGLPPAPALPKSLAEATATAQRLHPSILQAQHQVTVAELAVQAAAAERLPTIKGTASASAYDYSVSDNTQPLGLSLTMSQTLYAGGTRSSAHRQALANRDRVTAALLQTTRIIAQNVAVSWANIEVAKAQIISLDQQIAAATIAYEGVKEEATLGARTTLEVLDAEQELLTAQADKITAEANYQVSLYSLLSSMGLLTVERLNLGIPTYDPAAYYNAVQNAPHTSVQGESLDRVLRAIGK